GCSTRSSGSSLDHRTGEFLLAARQLPPVLFQRLPTRSRHLHLLPLTYKSRDSLLHGLNACSLAGALSIVPEPAITGVLTMCFERRSGHDLGAGLRVQLAPDSKQALDLQLCHLGQQGEVGIHLEHILGDRFRRAFAAAEELSQRVPSTPVADDNARHASLPFDSVVARSRT